MKPCSIILSFALLWTIVAGRSLVDTDAEEEAALSELESPLPGDKDTARLITNLIKNELTATDDLKRMVRSPQGDEQGDAEAGSQGKKGRGKGRGGGGGKGRGKGKKGGGDSADAAGLVYAELEDTLLSRLERSPQDGDDAAEPGSQGKKGKGKGRGGGGKGRGGKGKGKGKGGEGGDAASFAGSEFGLEDSFLERFTRSLQEFDDSENVGIDEDQASLSAASDDNSDYESLSSDFKDLINSLNSESSE